MKNECSIVGDLLALYQDGLVSEDTAAFVEEHLARCAVCRARLEQLRAPAAPQEAAQEERAFLTFAARWKKKRRRVLAAFAALAHAASSAAANNMRFIISSVLRSVLSLRPQCRRRQANSRRQRSGRSP